MRVSLVYPWKDICAGLANKVHVRPKGTHYLLPVERVRLAVVLFVILVLLALAVGCSSTCPPCVPKHEIVEVITPVYSCPAPPVLPPLVLPEWPPLPPNGTADEIKDWYVAMAETTKVRLYLLLERSEELERLLAAYNEE